MTHSADDLCHSVCDPAERGEPRRVSVGQPRSFRRLLLITAAGALVGAFGPVLRVFADGYPRAPWILVGVAVIVAAATTWSGPIGVRAVAILIATGTAFLFTRANVGGQPIALVAMGTGACVSALAARCCLLSHPVQRRGVVAVVLVAAAGGSWYLWRSWALPVALTTLALLAVELLHTRPRPDMARRSPSVGRLARSMSAVVTSVLLIAVAVDAIEYRRQVESRPITPVTLPSTTSSSPGIASGSTPANLPAAAGSEWAAAVAAEHAALPLAAGGPAGIVLGDVVNRYTNVEAGERRSIARPLCRCQVPTVWMTGASAAFGVGQRDQGTLASQLTIAAADQGFTMDVRNIATPGWTIWQSYLDVAARVDRGESADLVVFYAGTNDLLLSIIETLSTERVSGWGEPLIYDERARAAQHDATYSPRQIAAAIDRAGGVDAVARSAVDRFVRTRDAIRLELDRRGIDSLFYLPPDSFAGGYSYGVDELLPSVLPSELFDLASQVMRKVAAMLPSSDQESRSVLSEVGQPLFYDIVNVNEVGAERIADALLPLVERSLGASPAAQIADREGVVRVGGHSGSGGRLAGLRLRLDPVFTAEAPTALVADTRVGRLVVGERTGRVILVTTAPGASARTSVLLDLSKVTATDSNRGLLGLAMSEVGDEVYVYRTDRSGDAVVTTHRFDARRERLTDGTELLRIPMPADDHNGGTLRLAPDGSLWLALGDGGGLFDPDQRASDPSDPRGKILRLDPQRPGEWEIVASGLRNPFRASFDVQTGDYWIGDVGQELIEEIDVVRREDATPVNFGWSGFEGSTVLFADRTDPTARFPVFEYLHRRDNEQSCSAVVGGTVYRGREIPALRGMYLFGELCQAGLYALSGAVEEPRGRAQLWSLGVGLDSLVAIETGRDGEVWALSLGGVVARLRAETT